MKNLEYLVALHRVNGLGTVRLRTLLNVYQDPKLIWEENPQEFLSMGVPQNVVKALGELKKQINPEQYLESIYKSKIKILTIFDDDYPDLLKQIYDPPIIIYYQGEIGASDKNIAVVGTRKVTGYGKLVTEKFTQGLSQAGLTIVSGLARGVDSYAHQTVVKSDGKTLAVLGGGLNKIFPPENTSLAQEIAQKYGAILTEFPPDYPSLPGNFPARNRIISGLSLGVLVTEAAQDSGSLITANLALEQGREVFAVPGPITSELSTGPMSLIKQGAKLVTDVSEILEELGITNKIQDLRLTSEIELSETEQKILEILLEEKHIDDICRDLNFSAAVVSASLIKMEIKGAVKSLGGGNYLKIC